MGGAQAAGTGCQEMPTSTCSHLTLFGLSPGESPFMAWRRKRRREAERVLASPPRLYLDDSSLPDGKSEWRPLFIRNCCRRVLPDHQHAFGGHCGTHFAEKGTSSDGVKALVKVTWLVVSLGPRRAGG